LKSKKIKDQL